MSTVIKQLATRLKGLQDEMKIIRTDMNDLKVLVGKLNENINALIEPIDLDEEIDKLENEEEETDTPTDPEEEIATPPKSAPKLTSLKYLKDQAKKKQPQ